MGRAPDRHRPTRPLRQLGRLPVAVRLRRLRPRRPLAPDERTRHLHLRRAHGSFDRWGRELERGHRAAPGRRGGRARLRLARPDGRPARGALARWPGHRGRRPHDTSVHHGGRVRRARPRDTAGRQRVRLLSDGAGVHGRRHGGGLPRPDGGRGPGHLRRPVHRRRLDRRAPRAPRRLGHPRLPGQRPISRDPGRHRGRGLVHGSGAGRRHRGDPGGGPGRGRARTHARRVLHRWRRIVRGTRPRG